LELPGLISIWAISVTMNEPPLQVFGFYHAARP